MDSQAIKEKIETALPSATVQVAGEGDRFEIVVVSPEFEGLSRVKQHQKVYSVLWEEMKGPVHALTIKTFTPEQYQSKVGADDPSKG